MIINYRFVFSETISFKPTIIKSSSMKTHKFRFHFMMSGVSTAEFG